MTDIDRQKDIQTERQTDIQTYSTSSQTDTCNASSPVTYFQGGIACNAPSQIIYIKQG